LAEIAISTSDWPLFITHFPREFSTVDLDDYFERVREIMRQGRRYVLILDLRVGASANASAVVRKRSAEFLKETETVAKQLCLGTVYVTSSAIYRGALTAIFWISKPPAPYIIVGDYDEGVRSARERASEAALAT
jgi:hypothetical protein